MKLNSYLSWVIRNEYILNTDLFWTSDTFKETDTMFCVIEKTKETFVSEHRKFKLRYGATESY